MSTRQNFGGQVLFLDRPDINTDEIIPARYLTEVSKEALKPHLLEDLELDGFSHDDIKTKEWKVIVTRGNFGCGSSREHAPWALEVNNITAVIAPGFARIFRQNMFNCGMMAITLPEEAVDDIFSFSKNENVVCDIDLDKKSLIFKSETAEKKEIKFDMGGFEMELVRSGGWVEFADTRY